MADYTYAVASPGLGVIKHPMVHRMFHRTSVLAALLRKVPARSHKVHGTIEVDGGGSASYVADAANAPSAINDTPLAYDLGFAILTARITVGNFAREVAALMRNPNDFANPLLRQLQNAIYVVASKFNVDLYTGSGVASPQNLAGMDLAFAATGTYAAIDRAVYPSWGGTVKSNGGVARPITFDLIQEIQDAIYKAKGFVPPVALCGVSQFAKIGKLFTSQRDFQQAMEAGKLSVPDLAGGFDRIHYGGTTFIKDKDCGETKIYFHNPDSFEVEVVPQIVEDDGEFVLEGMPEEKYGSGSVGFNVKVIKLGKTGDKVDLQVVCKAQAINRIPPLTGILSDLL